MARGVRDRDAEVKVGQVQGDLGERGGERPDEELPVHRALSERASEVVGENEHESGLDDVAHGQRLVRGFEDAELVRHARQQGLRDPGDAEQGGHHEASPSAGPWVEGVLERAHARVVGVLSFERAGHALAKLPGWIGVLGEEAVRGLGLTVSQLVGHHRLGRSREASTRDDALGPHLERVPKPEAALAEVLIGRPSEQRLALPSDHTLELIEALLCAVREEGGVAVAEVLLDPALELAGVADPVADLRRQRPRDDQRELLGRIVGCGRRSSRDARDDLHQGVSAMRGRAGEHFVEHRTEQVHVGRRAELRAATAEHLRSHVRRGARELVRVVRARDRPPRLLVEGDGEPPVHHVDLAVLAHHHVVRLQVAVKDPARVSERDRVADAHEHAQVPLEQIGGPEPAPYLVRVAHEARPVEAVDLLEHHERRPARVACDVVDGDDVGVLDRARDPRLAHERERRALAPLLGPEALDRDRPAERALGAQPHDAHAALADDLVKLERDPVGSEGLRPRLDRRRDRLFGRVHHGAGIQPQPREGGLDGREQGELARHGRAVCSPRRRRQASPGSTSRWSSRRRASLARGN